MINDIIDGLFKHFVIFKEGNGSRIWVHCLRADVKEVLGDSWYKIVREFTYFDYSNLDDEEIELEFYHSLNLYINDYIVNDHGAWGYKIISRIEEALASNADAADMPYLR